ncbi:MAG: hypothetical protein DRJ15_10840 [Bacteroidetes bacterium]|nr:MAG: hypothetical protein DRJ15_10840 [Bacteroidota bacterium]
MLVAIDAAERACQLRNKNGDGVVLDFQGLAYLSRSYSKSRNLKLGSWGWEALRCGGGII